VTAVKQFHPFLEDDESRKALGLNIRCHRVRRGWSQRDLANQVDAGLSTVHRWETGKSLPDLKALGRLATAFAVPALSLLNPILMIIHGDDVSRWPVRRVQQ
jgi:transcriptional regulator with XRE-family HTH domain